MVLLDIIAWPMLYAWIRVFVDLQVAPASAAEASIVGRFQLLMVSNTPSSSSPLVVKPVTRFPAMTDLEVAGSMMPGKMAPPWQLPDGTYLGKYAFYAQCGWVLTRLTQCPR